MSMKIHFQNERGWMNDPNGLVFFKGRFHAFFQHYPHAPRWGQMHWGHCVSDDLITWEELPIALFPDQPYDNGKNGGCFSGSAIEKDGKLYMFYTSVDEEGRQTQSLAFTEDGLKFSKYEGNPIIDECPLGSNRDFRDPKVFKYGNEYRMVVGAGVKNTGSILLYRSSDLINWEYVGILLEDGRFGNVIECPNLFPLGDKWVLMFSSIKAMPYRVIFATGSFDGTSFVPEVPDGQPESWPYFTIETGPDFYAPQILDMPDGRKVNIAWMYNWSRREDKGQLQVGAFTFPREMSFDKAGRLVMFPISEGMHLLKKESSFVLYDNGELRIRFGDRTVLARPFATEPEVLTLEDVGSVELFINGGVENITVYVC